MRYRFSSKNYILLLALLLLIGLSSSPFVVYAESSSDADAALTSAKNKLVECLSATNAAEAAGANISDLTNTLNNAGLLLSNAESAYSSGDFQTAATLSAQCQIVLTNFISTAASLQSSASQRRSMDFLVTVVGSIAGTTVVIVGSLSVWVLLKRKYEWVGEAK